MPFDQSARMAAELARHGVVHQLVSEPEWGHGFGFGAGSDPKVSKALERAVSFLSEFSAAPS